MKESKMKDMECIAILAVRCDMKKAGKVEHLERQQEKYIRTYAKAHGIKIVGVLSNKGMGQLEINRLFNKALNAIGNRKVQGIIAINMRTLSVDLPDAYLKVGKVRSTGGEMITVDEGRLMLRVQRG